MAITITRQPQDTTGVKNPVEYTLTSTNQTQCGFRFVGSLYIQKEPWNNSAYEKVIEVRKYPLQSTNNNGAFDFSNIIEDFIKVQFDLITGTPKIGISNSYLRYYVIFQEEYEPACDGISAKYNSITTSNKTVFNGRIDFANYRNFLLNGWYYYTDNFLSGAPVYSSNGATPINPPVYQNYIHTIRPNDIFPVVFHTNVAPALLQTYLSFETIQNNGLKKFKLPNITSYIGSHQNESYQFFATDFGTRQTDDLSQGNINTLVVDENTISYTAVVVSSDNSTSQSAYYNSGNINIAIPDGTGYATSKINVPISVLPTEIDVKLNIVHPYLGDLLINLVSPSGKIINLYNRSLGSSNNFVNTVFSSYSGYPAITDGTNPGYTGTFRWALGSSVGRAPYISNTTTMKAVLNDYSSYGDWTLVVMDMGINDTGVFSNWSISFKSKNLTEVTPKHKFSLTKCCSKNNVRFYWLNKLGGWDAFSFTRNKSKKLDIQRDNYEKYVDYNRYNLYDAGAIQYNTQIMYSESVFSDWIDLPTSEWLSELLSSPAVYMQENGDYMDTPSLIWGSLPYPALDSNDLSIQRIVITDNTYSYNTKDMSKLVNFNLNYQLSNQNNSIRF
ncbi:Proprotein convertase, P [uncultured Caudovirales phage]|uniref:Proprotein convertase, P n=1 Tax=uncultured Caudovirales phage TaxID=2100421 RepID=A0A6J7WGC6_9CAUD|nr:Proprotein convertase, P [uncultured Caudovirales phage]